VLLTAVNIYNIKITLNSNIRNGLLNSAEIERAVSCPDLEIWVGTARPSIGKAAAVAELVAL